MENHIPEVLMVILSKIQVAFTAFVSTLIGLAFLVLDESLLLITITYVMLIANVLSGWLLMWKERQDWSHDKWFKMCMKFMWFAGLILMTKSIKVAYDIEVSIGIFISAFLTINEFKSVISNVGKLTGIDIWNAIADYVDFNKLAGLFKKNKSDH